MNKQEAFMAQRQAHATAGRRTPGRWAHEALPIALGAAVYRESRRRAQDVDVEDREKEPRNAT